MMPGNVEPAEIPVMRRLKVAVPCLVVSLLLTTWMSCDETQRYGQKVALDTKMLFSAMSGPLACWTDEGFGAEQKVCCTVLALVLALGILCHPLRPGRATAVVTILASTVWFIFGNAITHIGF
jgi:hypothetical protein